MSFLRAIGRCTLAAGALGAFGWPWSTGTHTTLGLIASGLILTSAVSPTVPRGDG